MSNMQVKYLGSLRCEATHSDSGNQIITDAPKDNHGKGEAFSPTDLLCTSYASCIITIMGITAKNKNILLGDIQADIEKVMASNPRRVAQIKVKLIVWGSYSESEKATLERAARECPVAMSLHPETEQRITFEYKE
jgi:uncharacterized OsmC-like protein